MQDIFWSSASTAFKLILISGGFGVIGGLLFVYIKDKRKS